MRTISPFAMTPEMTPAPVRTGRMIGFAVLGVLILLALWAFSSYNSLVTSHESVTGAWAQVEAQYQRRFDLVPNLAATVQGAADFEKTTLTQVTQARTQWQAGATREAKIDAAEQFDAALSRLLVTVEAYPQLQATQAFRDMMVQLEGTENRIQVARQDYNQTVQAYNVKVKRFPTVVLASMLGFGPEEFFDAAAGSETAPRVDFSTSAPSL